MLADPRELEHLDVLTRHNVIYGIARALEFLHTKGFVHGKLWPEHILLDAQVEPIVIGFCDLREKIPTGDWSVLCVENRRFCAPEREDIGLAVDIFAFGVLLYQMVYGKPIYPNDTDLAIQIKLRAGERPDLTKTDYRTLIQKCWSLNPSDRPQIREIVHHLETAAQKQERFQAYQQKFPKLL
jgi:serine/threonine protein kinase